MSEKLLNPDQVADKLGITRRTALIRRDEDGFPAPISIGKGLAGLRWAESEVDDWIRAKLAERP